MGRLPLITAPTNLVQIYFTFSLHFISGGKRLPKGRFIDKLWRGDDFPGGGWA